MRADSGHGLIYARAGRAMDRRGGRMQKVVGWKRSPGEGQARRYMEPDV